jgi:hypothetical protein
MKEVLLSFNFHESREVSSSEEYVVMIPLEIGLAQLKGTTMLKSSIPRKRLSTATKPIDAIFFYSVQAFPGRLSGRSHFDFFRIEEFHLEYHLPKRLRKIPEREQAYGRDVPCETNEELHECLKRDLLHDIKARESFKGAIAQLLEYAEIPHARGFEHLSSRIAPLLGFLSTCIEAGIYGYMTASYQEKKSVLNRSFRQLIERRQPANVNYQTYLVNVRQILRQLEPPIAWRMRPLV